MQHQLDESKSTLATCKHLINESLSYIKSNNQTQSDVTSAVVTDVSDHEDRLHLKTKPNPIINSSRRRN